MLTLVAGRTAGETLISADFADGNTSTSVDGFTGMAGSGWGAAWKTTSNNGTISGTVTAANPLNTGGNYLAGTLVYSGTTTTCSGTIARKFDTTQVSSTAPYTITFDIRLDSPMTSSSDRVLVFGDTGGSYVATTGPNNTFCVQGIYRGGNPTWQVLNSGTPVDTGMALTQGIAYSFRIEVEPSNRSFRVSIRNGTATYQSEPIGFRSTALDGGKFLYFGSVVRNTTGSMDFSVDNITIAPTDQPEIPSFPIAVDANFSAGNLATHTDGFQGVAGAGWGASWKTTASSAVLSGNVTAQNPLNDGGSYLSANLTITGTSSTIGTGTVARRFNTRTIDSTRPYTVKFDVRLDSAFSSSSDKLLLFGDVSSSYVATAGGTSTYCIQGVYNSGNPTWFVSNSGTLINTGIAIAQGTVYSMRINIDPERRSYNVSINDGTAEYQSGTLGFRSTTSNQGGSTLYFGGTVRNVTNTLTFSIDAIHVESTAVFDKPDFPEKFVPKINGIATHFNTKVDFSMTGNASAMDQMRDAGLEFVRYVIPWQDVERTQGTFTYTDNVSYSPGYISGQNAFVSRGLRPIICLAFANTIYGLSQTTPITSAEGLAAYRNYCRNIAKQFRGDNPIFEVWNEPNLDAFGPYTAAEYMNLLDSAIAGIIEGWREGRDTPDLADPIIIGPSSSGAYYSNNFFDGTMNRGILDKVDAVSFHPYQDTGGKPEDIAPAIDSLKSKLVAMGKPNMPFVITEWGWSTGNLLNEINEATQAKFAARQVLMGYFTGMEINCVYSLEDARNDDNRTTTGKHYGLFKTMGADYQKLMTAKPSVSAVAAVNDNLNGLYYIQKVDMGNNAPLSSAKDWCLVFWNPTTSAAKAAIWTTDTGITKTTPDLKPLLNLSESQSINFTDSPAFIDLPGYHP